MSSIENIISTVSCISSDDSYLPDVNNIICIDTSNNRIGINTIKPNYSIDLNDNNLDASSGIIKCKNLILYNIPDSPDNLLQGQLYKESDGTLKIKI
tara:strand:+ start:213 stop:503 length:291 start_codon:yes stop_codon:yes gene_type:complete